MMNLGFRSAAGLALITCLAASAPAATARAATPTNTKKGFVDNISRQTVANDDYRHVLYTGQHLQLVLMSLKPGEEIGAETHLAADQFFRIETGEGEIDINGVRHRVSAGSAMLVPAGARHNVRNTGKSPLKLYTLYAPPLHRRDVVERTKADAEKQRERFDGQASE